MNTVESTYTQGFAGQSYAQWFLFLVLFILFYSIAISLNSLVRRSV